MNRIRLAVVLVVVLLGGAAIGYWFAHHGSAGRVASPEASARGDRKVLYWHDPMVPGQRFDKPGKSPFMDMQLVPVYADEEPGGAAVRVAPAVAQNLGIRLGRVEKAVLQPKLAAVGSVVFDERSVEVVQARVEGYVIRLHVKSPLEQVRRGQPLADILAPQWLAAQEEYLSLLDSQTERGRAIRDAARQRLAVLGVPETTIQAIERDRKTRGTTTVVAPRDGVLTELSVREGSSFAAGSPLFRVNGLDTVWVNAQVPESQASLVTDGATATARANAWPGEEFAGRVLGRLPDVDRQTRTLSVRVELENPGRSLAPGMFVSLDFKTAAGDPQLVVPSEAVIITGERGVVIVAHEGGGFDVAAVQVGAEVDGKTTILSGLTEGQSIVLSGQFLIDSEASLRSTVSRLSTEPDAVNPSAGAENEAAQESHTEAHP
jgi:membrane fusion protein, copper/silver efflux system